MGSDDGPADERPAHTVKVAAFEIDRLSVRNSEFARFLQQFGALAPDGRRYFDWDARGGGHDSPLEQIRSTERGRHLSRAPRAGHHNIGFRCAR